MDRQPDFDIGFPEYEQLPRQFSIELRERDNGKVYLRWNGVFIGDPLTDNIGEEDGFRYHDVIHFAPRCDPALVANYAGAVKAETQE